MATYYVDPSDGGSDSGTQANPWTSIHSAIAAVAAGDVVYLRNTETLSVQPVIATAGSEAVGRVYWIGCPTDSWTPDGTTFKLDCDDAVAGISLAQPYQWFENIEIYDSTVDGFDETFNGDYSVYANCIAHGCDVDGFNGAGAYNFYDRCRSYLNTMNGFGAIASNNYFHLCVSYDNGDNGYDAPNTGVQFIRCISHDNGATAGDAGFDLDLANIVVNCVANGEVNGVEINDGVSRVIASRLTNCTNGIYTNASGDCALYGYNVFYNNTADVAGVGTDNQSLPVTADSNKYDPDADDGFNAQATEDFNLKADRTYNGDGTDTVGLGVGS